MLHIDTYIFESGKATFLKLYHVCMYNVNVAPNDTTNKYICIIPQNSQYTYFIINTIF